jgi:two-component system, response regulator YesN
MISEKIVLVDDDPRVHQILNEVLFEYQLVPFLDPHKALEFFAIPNEVKLAIIDVRMKGMTGIELLQKVKRMNPELAVMIMTAHSSQDIVIEALRMHADDYLEKPFDIKELKERVKAILKERSKYDHLCRDPKAQTERIRQFIERNYTNASLEYIAKEMCLSTHYLGRFFLKHNQCGFREYKLKVRMEKAMDLLCRSSMDISEIAYDLGYENPESFMRAFKRYAKKTPSDYRAEQVPLRKK